MGTFKLTTPDGKKYRVTADTPAAAMAALSKMRGADAPTVDPSTNQPPGVPQFQPPGVEGYDPQTGNVTQPMSRMQSAGFGAADIGGMGFADELAAPIGAMISGDPREQVLEQMRGQSQQAQEQHPGAFLGGQVGGGLAGAVAGGLPAVLRGGSSILGKTLMGMGMGGAGGAAHGAGTGTDLASRGSNALQEGIVGALVGGGLPVIGAGASNLYRAGSEALTQRGMPASADIMRLVKQYVGDVPTARAKIAQAGPNAMMADAGQGARDFLDATIQRGGPGADVARTAIEHRAAAEGQRVTSTLDSALGAPQGVESMQKGIRQSTASARSSTYGDAYSKAIDYSAPEAMEIEQIVKTRVPKSAIDAANALMRAKGEKSQQILAHVGDDGSVVFEKLPDVRQLDYITRGLNEVADEAHGKGKLGGTTAIGSAYESLSREIRDRLKSLVPEYATALETAADPIRRVKAVKFGSTLLSKGVTRDEVEEFANGITGPERKAVLEGVRANLDDAVANVERALTDPNVDARETIKELKLLSSRSARTKLAAVIDDPQVVDDMFRQIDEAAKGFELRAATAANSGTARRQNIFDTVDRLTAPGPVRTAAMGKPINATQRLIQALTGQTEEALQGRQDEIYSGAANLMTQPATKAALDQVETFGKRDLASQLMQQRIAGLLMGGVRPTAPLAGSEVRQWLERR